MNINQKIAPFAAFILKNIKTHKNRKRFAKFFGPFFDGTVAKTAYGFPMIARWYDNTSIKSRCSTSISEYVNV